MASGPITSWQIDGETVEIVADFIFLGSKIYADGDCSYEIKRRLLLEICWHEYSIFTASSFRIWNSSTGIISPPLTLFVVILPMAHLTSHSKMSGSRWVSTPPWLSRSWRSFLYSSSVYSCHLFLISSAYRSIPFLSFIEPIFAIQYHGNPSLCPDQ